LDDVAYRGSRRRLCHSISAIGPKIPYTKAVKSRSLSPADKRQQIASLALQRHYQVLASFASRSFFLIGELLLGKLSETIVVQGNAPHNRPSFLVCHLIGNRASFLCTKAPMVRVPETNFLQGITSINGRDVQAIFSAVATSIDFAAQLRQSLIFGQTEVGGPQLLPPPPLLTPARSLPSG